MGAPRRRKLSTNDEITELDILATPTHLPDAEFGAQVTAAVSGIAQTHAEMAEIHGRCVAIYNDMGASFGRRGEALQRRGASLERRGASLERIGESLERIGESLERRDASLDNILKALEEGRARSAEAQAKFAQEDARYRAEQALLAQKLELSLARIAAEKQRYENAVPHRMSEHNQWLLDSAKAENEMRQAQTQKQGEAPSEQSAHIAQQFVRLDALFKRIVELVRSLRQQLEALFVQRGEKANLSSSTPSLGRSTYGTFSQKAEPKKTGEPKQAQSNAKYNSMTV